jgi:hypothetical protein
VGLREDLYGWGGKSYKVAFYGNNAEWALLIGAVLLRDLAYDDFTYGYSQNLMALNYDYPLYDYKFFLLKLKDYTTFGQADALEDLHPALFIFPLLNKAFNYIGYTMNSDFFSTDYAKKLMMPIPILNKYLQGQYGLDYLNASFENSNPYLTDSGGNFTPIGIAVLDNQTYAPAIGANPYNVATARYTFPQDGYYLVKSYTRIYDLSYSAPYIGVQFMAAVVEDLNIVFDWFWGDLTPFTVNREFRFERLVYKTAGQFIDFIYVGGGDPINTPLVYYKVDWQNEIIGEAEIVNNTLLNPKYLLQDLRVIDMIKGLAHAFNLVFETNDNTRTVRIEPADTYLLEDRFPNTRVIQDGFYNSQRDYTPYVDLSKGGELVSDVKNLSNLRLAWEEDSNDPTVAALESQQYLGVFQSRYVFPVNRYKDGETIIRNPFFAPTLVIADEEIVVRDLVNAVTKIPMVPIIWRENYLETSTSSVSVESIVPRLLVGELPDATNNGTIRIFTGVVVEIPTPLAYMVDYNDTNGYQTSLSFSDVNVNGFPISGLLKRFYLSEMMRIQSGKYLEISILWDVLKINRLTFREKIILNGDKYILQEINSFNVSKNESTKTYLQYDFKEPDCDQNIQNTIIIAKVNSGSI